MTLAHIISECQKRYNLISSRQKLILKAIIEEYVKTAEPIGSKALTSLPYLHFSSATLRHDMAELEQKGFLTKTHTSSGRIPSEKGYKYYVDNLVTRDSEVQSSFPIIDQIITSNSLKRDHAIEEAIKLLSELTSYTAFAVGPKGVELSIKKIDFVPLNDNEATVLIVTNQGHVEHQTIYLPNHISINNVREVVKTLDDLLRGKTLDEAMIMLKKSFKNNELKKFIDFQEQFLQSFVEAFSKFAEENYYFSGMVKMFDQPEFKDSQYIKRFIEMLDRRDIVKFIGRDEGLQVRFGSDLKLIPMENCSVISIPYHISDQEHGTIAIIGPNRMPYGKVIPLLEYIALNLGKLYK